MNQLQLGGTVASAAEWSHVAHGTAFYRFYVAVERLSGNRDLLRVLAPEQSLKGIMPEEGMRVQLEGQIRSFNNSGSESGNRLLISALARELSFGGEAAPRNHVALGGTLCRAPGYRRTPLGREICDIMLAVPRVYGRNDYIPLIAWGQVARSCSRLEAGGALRVEGRFQSRMYTKLMESGAEERTAFEVSVTKQLTFEEG